MGWLQSWLGGGTGGGSDTVVGSQVPYFRLAGPQEHGTGGVTVPWPDHEPNDIALLLVENQDSTGISFTDAAGFAAVANSPQYFSLASRLSVFWCRATSNEMSSPVIADPGDHVIAQIVTFRGVKSTGNPWDVTAGATIGDGTHSTMTLPSATTATDNCLIVNVGTTNADGGSAAWASGWTNSGLLDVHEITDIRTDDGGGGGIAAAVGVLESAGATGATVFTSTGNTEGGALTIALLPEPPPTIPDADVTPPTITLISPSDQQIYSATPIVVDIADDVAISLDAVLVRYPDGSMDVVHTGFLFGDRYQGSGNSREILDAGLRHRLTIIRDNGWRAAPRLEFLVRDSSGNPAVVVL